MESAGQARPTSGKYLDQTLEPDERVVHLAYLHWIMFVPSWFLLLIGTPLLLFLPLGLILVTAGLIALIPALIKRYTTEIAVTDRRVILKRGLIKRDTIEINADKIESIDVQR